MSRSDWKRSSITAVALNSGRPRPQPRRAPGGSCAASRLATRSSPPDRQRPTGDTGDGAPPHRGAEGAWRGAGAASRSGAKAMPLGGPGRTQGGKDGQPGRCGWCRRRSQRSERSRRSERSDPAARVRRRRNAGTLERRERCRRLRAMSGWAACGGHAARASPAGARHRRTGVARLVPSRARSAPGEAGVVTRKRAGGPGPPGLSATAAGRPSGRASPMAEVEHGAGRHGGALASQRRGGAAGHGTDGPAAAGGGAAAAGHLDEDAAQEWRRVAAAAVALGSLRACDLPALALLAETLGLARAAQRALLAEGFAIATAAGNPKGNPAARVLAEARQHAAQMLKDFGLTPSSRGQVKGWPSREKRDADRTGRRCWAPCGHLRPAAEPGPALAGKKMCGAGSRRGRACGGASCGAGSIGPGRGTGASATPVEMPSPIGRAPSVPSGPSVPGGEGDGRGGRREGRRRTRRRNAGTLGTLPPPSSNAAGRVGRSVRAGDHGEHDLSGIIAEDDAAFAAADPNPCQGWGRGFESLRPLQSALCATFSAAVTGAERRRFCGDFRAHLEGARAERGPELVSGWRSLSGP